MATLKEISDMVSDIIETQVAVQNKVDPDWLTNGHNFEFQALVELCEAATNLGPTETTSWWKQTGTPHGQVVLEYVDALVFMICQSVVKEGQMQTHANLMHSIEKSRERVNEEGFTPALGNINAEAQLITDTAGGWYWSGITGKMTNILTAALYRLKDFEEFYAWYIGKSTLNVFRKANGYKEGTYIKLWDGVDEDNVWLERYISEMPMHNVQMNRASINTYIGARLEADYAHVLAQAGK